jgi:hypothetical protein
MEVPHSRDLRAHRSNLICSLRQLGTSHFLVFFFVLASTKKKTKRRKSSALPKAEDATA